jgi:hypothetical protein
MSKQAMVFAAVVAAVASMYQNSLAGVIYFAAVIVYVMYTVCAETPHVGRT